MASYWLGESCAPLLAVGIEGIEIQAPSRTFRYLTKIQRQPNSAIQLLHSVPGGSCNRLQQKASACISRHQQAMQLSCSVRGVAPLRSKPPTAYKPFRAQAASALRGLSRLGALCQRPAMGRWENMLWHANRKQGKII